MASSNGPGTKGFLGFVTGVAFGALLQRGRLARHETIVGQLLLRDGRVIKTMASAVAVGAVGIHLLAQRGLIKKEIKPMKVGGIVAGGVLFGAGLALLGYCPGTCVAAVGEGHRDAVAGALGMLTGAGVFVALYPKLAPMLEAGDLGKLTLPTALDTSPWPWVAGLGASTAAGALLLDRAA